jgi:hypothetical protein
LTPKLRKQAHAQSADVPARVAEDRLNVAPTHDCVVVERDMALAVRDEAAIEGERLLGWRRLEQRQVALLAGHGVEHSEQPLKVRLGKMRDGDVHAA